MSEIKLNYKRDEYWKRKIASKMKELELEIEECPEFDKGNQYYEYKTCREFALSKLYELLEEEQ